MSNPAVIEALCLLSGAGIGVAISESLGRLRRLRSDRLWTDRLLAERSSASHLCFSTLEALAYAIEASDPYNIGHLDCVQRTVRTLGNTLRLGQEEMTALRAAALLHTVGRLGVPDHILHKAGALTAEEQEKLRSHPVLAARILASIPFPWPVVPLVRHYAEHWDGTGYPDNLKGEDIPLGARILAVASAHSALMRPRSFRPAITEEEAMSEVVSRSGSQFDPSVISAFLRVVEADQALAVDSLPVQDVPSASVRRKRSRRSALPAADILPSARLSQPEEKARASGDVRDALDDIAAAQRESLGLYTLARTVGSSLHLEAVGNTLLQCTRDIVPCSVYVLFLPEDDGEFLRAHAAIGVNHRHFLGSLAQNGTYLTGRAFGRGEIITASFLADDLILRDVSEPWVPFRSTMIVPLSNGGTTVGTLNLYAEEPNAFGLDAQRVMRLVSTQAGRAIDNARRFAAVQETAYTDALTGLRNARYLREYLDREINRAMRESVSLAVLNIDLDNFKPINDQFGHARGDQTLREVADILAFHVRNYDLAARYAGDEFVVVLGQAGRKAAEGVAAKLKQAVERHGQRLCARDAGFPQLGISIGVALYPEDATDMQGLLCRSDAAMYSDKQNRKSTRSAA